MAINLYRIGSTNILALRLKKKDVPDETKPEELNAQQAQSEESAPTEPEVKIEKKAETEIRLIPPRGVRINGPADENVKEAQGLLLYIGLQGGSFKGGYKFVAEESGEFGRFWGLHSASNLQDLEIAWVLGDARSSVEVRKADGTIDYEKLKGAIESYNIAVGKTKHQKKLDSWTLRKLNEELLNGNLTGAVTVNPSAWTTGDKPSNMNLLGGVANTKMSAATLELTGQNLRRLREEYLRGVIKADQNVSAKLSIVGKDDPVRVILDNAHDIVGGIKDFRTSYDERKGIIVNGGINWDKDKAAVVAKEAVKAKFEEILPDDDKGKLDLDQELISEIEGGVIGYAVLAVLIVASDNGPIDLAKVREKADKALEKRVPTLTEIQVLPYQVILPPAAEPEPSAPAPAPEVKPEASAPEATVPAVPSGSAAPVSEGDKPKPEATQPVPSAESTGANAQKAQDEREINPKPEAAKPEVVVTGNDAKKVIKAYVDKKIELTVQQETEFLVDKKITLTPEQYEQAKKLNLIKQ